MWIVKQTRPLRGFLLGVLASGLLGSACPVFALQSAAPEKPYEVLEDRESFREAYNTAEGKVRVIAILSPTCSRCLENVQQLQEYVLDGITTDELAVFIVWVKVRSGDRKDSVDYATRYIRDSRVRQYWDESRLLNSSVLDAIDFEVKLSLFDFFLLYERDALWEDELPRPGFWMHESKKVPGAPWNALGFALQVRKALSGEPLDPMP